MRTAEKKKIVEVKPPLFSRDGKKVYDATSQAHDLLSLRYKDEPMLDRLPHLKRSKAKGNLYFYFNGIDGRIRLPHIFSKEFAWEYQVCLAEKHGRKRPAVRQPKRGFVYFIGAKGAPVKIGHSVDPVGRLASMQTGNHERLLIHAIAEGGQPLEFQYHQKFKHHRLHGEWFKAHPEILDEIEMLRGSAIGYVAKLIEPQPQPPAIVGEQENDDAKSV